MYNSFKGMKGFGHFLKKMLPMRVFEDVLFCYHKIIAWLAIPKAALARKRIDERSANFRRGSGRIRFGFYVVLDAMFQWRRVFELMLKDDRFDPFIVVVPRIGWQLGDTEDTVEKTYASLVKDYGKSFVRKGYENGRFNNFISDCDACSMMNVYRGLAVREFETEHFAMHGIPIFASPYGYHSGNRQGPEYFGMPSLKYVRYFYLSSETEAGYFIKYQHLKARGDRVRIVGCPKTDAIKHESEQKNRIEKVVLLAPHHSVIPSVDSGICLGNFLKYKELFLSLPKKYPQIHWIFRPHPHLRLRLTKDYTWKMSDWENYVREWESNPNAEYEAGGAYYDSFERSDAIIQDCASFLPEYFYTGKPCCYMLASEEAKKAQFDGWGQELLAHTYQAFSEEQITKFIEDVVIGGKDTMREMRHKFAKERVMINYPHASEAIVEDIAQLLGRGKEKNEKVRGAT